MAAVAAAAAGAAAIPTGRRCQGVRVDGRQRKWRAGRRAAMAAALPADLAAGMARVLGLGACL